MQPTFRHRRLLWVFVLLVSPGLLTGCGDKVVGGRGKLVQADDGAPSLLVLEGSPYQMGWWQGRLLGDAIRSLHARWKASAIRAQVGLAHDMETGAAANLTRTIGEYVDQSLFRIPERYRQELRGIADATGLSLDELLFTEVMRDGLRIWLKTMEPQLPGVLAVAQAPAGPEARAWWWGA